MALTEAAQMMRSLVEHGFVGASARLLISD
jgi:hypothetical protein